MSGSRIMQMALWMALLSACALVTQGLEDVDAILRLAKSAERGLERTSKEQKTEKAPEQGKASSKHSKESAAPESEEKPEDLSGQAVAALGPGQNPGELQENPEAEFHQTLDCDKAMQLSTDVAQSQKASTEQSLSKISDRPGYFHTGPKWPEVVKHTTYKPMPAPFGPDSNNVVAAEYAKMNYHRYNDQIQEAKVHQQELQKELKKQAKVMAKAFAKSVEEVAAATPQKQTNKSEETKKSKSSKPEPKPKSESKPKSSKPEAAEKVKDDKVKTDFDNLHDMINEVGKLLFP